MPLINVCIKADRESIRKSLDGTWRPEHLFLLKQSYTRYNFIQQQIALVEREIETVLQQMAALPESTSSEATPFTLPRKTAKKKGQPSFEARKYLQAIYGVDVLDIYGISDTAALEILLETGTGLSKWPTEEHYVS